VIESLGLQHGRMYNLPQGSVAVFFLSNPDLDGQPRHVELSIGTHDGSEQRVTVYEGDQFAIGPDSWVLEGVDNATTYDYVVRIRKLPAGH
jgi:Family of unknown function (DUF6406)